jgi:hypothetical protein
MATLGKLWAGHVYGTNTGNFFLELDAVEPTVTGTLRLMDSLFGIAVYRVAGKFEDRLTLRTGLLLPVLRNRYGPELKPGT